MTQIKAYKPRRIITDYIRQATRLEPEFERMRLNGERITDSPHYEPLRQKRRRVIETVFQSFSNLIALLEGISDNERLQEVFDEDLHQLFLAGNPPTFSRFISALVSCSNRRLNEDTNFRLTLIHTMQIMIANYMMSVSMTKLNEKVANTVIRSDFDRVSVWTELFASNVES